jgi:hypothetical protein
MIMKPQRYFRHGAEETPYLTYINYYPKLKYSSKSRNLRRFLKNLYSQKIKINKSKNNQPLHHTDVSDTADISEVQAASIFRIKCVAW